MISRLHNALRRFVIRLEPGHACPEQWFACGIVQEFDGREFYYFVVRLPSYQFMRHPWRRSQSWQKLSFSYHGLCSFELMWVDCVAPGQSQDD